MNILNKRYEYESLTRSNVNGSRKYLTPDGNQVPSVTTILSATKSQESLKILQDWKKRVGTVQATKITTEAANRGTRMHTFLENFIINGELSNAGSNPHSKISHNMAKSIVDKGMCNVSEVWGVEIPLYYPELYAGTTDCIGIHNNSTSIIDYKQTNKPKKKEWIDDYFIQLCAYAIAHNKLYDTKINKGVIMMCVREDDFNKEAEYQEFILEGNDFLKYINLWWDKVEQYYTKEFN